MTMRSLVRASLRHYRGLHGLVIAGVAVAVAVLAGALLVGASVRASLRDLALSRLGATDLVVSSPSFFRDALAGDLRGGGIGAAVPLVALTSAVTHEESRRTASRVQVFGIDERFLAFHGLEGAPPGDREAWISRGLAAALGAATSDRLVLRVARPTDIPLSTLQGRRDDVSELLRVDVSRVVGRDALGEFSLVPHQGEALTIFVSLARLRQQLGMTGRANGLLVQMAGPHDAESATATVQRAVAEHATLADLGLSIRTSAQPATTILESDTGLITDEVVRSTTAAARAGGHIVVPALAYLANALRVEEREIPYSVVVAMDLEAYERLAAAPAGPVPTMGAAAAARRTAHPPIHLNEWAAQDLDVAAGDTVEVDYYLWSDDEGLQTRSASFTFAGVVPMSGAGGDATLTPDYPGITDAVDVTAWDPPFPVDLSKVRPRDEAYWDRWRTAPKAFVPLDVGQRLWPSPFGSVTSVRTSAPAGGWPPPGAIDPFESGLSVRHARADALAAAEGTTDFGEYFVYFSFFLVVAGLLLAGLFFALSVEQRAAQLGLLAAVGFRAGDVRRLLLGEALVLALAGSALGVGAAVGYAALIMHGLRTWWVDAVGTTALTLHVDGWLLLAGVAGAIVATLVALTLSFRRLAGRSARALLTAGLTGSSGGGGGRLARYIAVRAAVVAAVLAGAGLAGALNQTAAFFGAGGLLLVAGCAAFAAWLRTGPARPQPSRRLARFGAEYARWRPTRSVLSTALIALACFIIVAVVAFRRDPAGLSLDRNGGTGGYVLMAEAVAPLMHNPDTPDGRVELGLTGQEALQHAQVTRFRLRLGDEASCLTLYQPTNPRIIAPEASFLSAEPRFRFARSLAETDDERANPWRLLERRFADGAIPAIADQTSLAYVFHLGVGDDFTFTPDGREPVTLRFVGALADSVLQSELIVGEDDFVRLFPRHEGYRLWLIDAPEADAEALTVALEDRLSDFGVDVVDTRARLAAYHQVENTYLSTFQALGALGLLLGTAGLAAVLARNVLERRRELGLLGAVGFTPRHLRTMVTAESALLVLTGLAIGTAAALVAITPALAERAGALPVGRLALLLAAVAATGLVASIGAVRLATSTRVIDAIKSE